MQVNKSGPMRRDRIDTLKFLAISGGHGGNIALGLLARQHTVEWVDTLDKAVDGDTNGNSNKGHSCARTQTIDNP